MALADALVKCGYVTIKGDSAVLTEQGAQWAAMTGLPQNACQAGTGSLRLCLDWSERRVHFAGHLPSTILRHLLETKCLERGDQRSLIVTRLGKTWFDKLGLDADGSTSVERRAPSLLISGA